MDLELLSHLQSFVFSMKHRGDVALPTSMARQVHNNSGNQGL